MATRSWNERLRLAQDALERSKRPGDAKAASEAADEARALFLELGREVFPDRELAVELAGPAARPDGDKLVLAPAAFRTSFDATRSALVRFVDPAAKPAAMPASLRAADRFREQSAAVKGETADAARKQVTSA